MKIYFIRPQNNRYNDVSSLIISTAIKQGASITIFENDDNDDISKLEALRTQIEKSDLVLADVSYPDANANIFLELGFAKSLQKECVIICELDAMIPVDLLDNRVILYDRNRLTDTLLPGLLKAISQEEKAKTAGKSVAAKQKESEKQKSIFVSYSHIDSNYLTRLEVHLRPFEKAGLIQLWADTRIKAGEKWKEKIEHALDRAAIAILLISADFLASDFIVDNELPPLLKAAEEKGTLILPVILKPCRFTRHESLSRFQAINDPKMPLSKMNENDQEETYVKVADRVDSLL